MSKKKVTLVEVGLRDGLQNEATLVSSAARIELAERLILAGAERIEWGAFVRADRVPQMAGSHEVVVGIQAWLSRQRGPRFKKVRGSVLVPNDRGMESALKVHAEEVAIFASASESFSQKNINCSIEESFVRFTSVIKTAKKNKIKVRGYLSCCFGCPYEGHIEEKKVVELAKRLIQMGCYEVSIGDTIGIAHPGQVRSLMKKLSQVIPINKIAGHFHDTRGLALANILTAYQAGIHIFDSSLGGLGGCPYAPGSAGNVATEEVVYMFEGMGVKTGIDLAQLVEANQWMAKVMKKELSSRLGRAGLGLA